MFPGYGAVVYRNEMGEPLGWDYPGEPEYDPDCYLSSWDDDDDEDEDEDEVQWCDAAARRGTGTGACGRPLDQYGQCDRASDHL